MRLTLTLTATALLLATPALAGPKEEAEVTRLAQCTTHLAALSVLAETFPTDARIKPLADRMNPLLPRVGARFDALRKVVGDEKTQAITEKVFADAKPQIEAVVGAKDPAAALVTNHGKALDACLTEIAKLPA
ncbi:hypothetical protein GVN21_06355 [Caulobacter sp. SLTY]|uniref:hypothetical protein n=1 Tax=Caulobacter sp. SLTY TaxID=2683262 RepID=UPI0014133BA6|nr:hypothetical protein [Caulobacter sp. SLTY]NBB14973.1 hypothetical protein [Caulobacter sp. SLTY]